MSAPHQTKLRPFDGPAVPSGGGLPLPPGRCGLPRPPGPAGPGRPRRRRGAVRGAEPRGPPAPPPAAPSPPRAPQRRPAPRLIARTSDRQQVSPSARAGRPARLCILRNCLYIAGTALQHKGVWGSRVRRKPAGAATPPLDPDPLQRLP